MKHTLKVDAVSAPNMLDFQNMVTFGQNSKTVHI